MWQYEKKLQYPVKIKNPNPKYAQIIISQYGGPDGELGASMRYLTQRYSQPYNEIKGMLTDIGTEEKYCLFYFVAVLRVCNGHSKALVLSQWVCVSSYIIYSLYRLIPLYISANR